MCRYSTDETTKFQILIDHSKNFIFFFNLGSIVRATPVIFFNDMKCDFHPVLVLSATTSYH